MSSPTLYYLRHGQTDWNAELRFQGQRDIPLNDTGRAQARANGRRLAALLGDGAGMRFIGSPLGRARETMEIVRAEMGLDPTAYELDERLMEASYGELEGSTLDEMKVRFPDMHRERRQARWDFQPPGGESHQMVLDRLLPWLDGIGTDSFVCAHGIVGRALRHHLLGIGPKDAGDYPFPQDRIFIWRDGTETQA